MNAIAFGNISTESRETQLPTWTLFLRDMEKAIGARVEFFYAPAYADIIDAMRENRVQVAHFGPAAAIRAVDFAHGEIAIRTSYKVGEDGYYALLLVHKDSPITSLEDVLSHRGTLSLVAAFLLDYGRATSTKSVAEVQHQQEVLDRLQWWHFKPSDGAQLDPIREIEKSSPEPRSIP